MIINYMLDFGAYEPLHGHTADAGFDLRLPDFYNSERCTALTLKGYSSIVIDTGVHFEIPTGYVGFIKSKSGLNVKANIVSEGVVDAGYTGSIIVKLYNHSPNDYTFFPGNKITQIVFLPIPEVTLNQVPFLTSTERGDNGFGSTGK